MKYYLDTCIWLNLFKKEKYLWKQAKILIEQIKNERDTIIISSIVIKELSYKLNNKFQTTMNVLKKEKYIQIIKTIPEDYEFARKLELNTKFRISFYDYIHIAITKRMKYIFVTRDKDLIELSRQIINVKKPEELIN